MYTDKASLLGGRSRVEDGLEWISRNKQKVSSKLFFNIKQNLEPPVWPHKNQEIRIAENKWQMKMSKSF